MNLINRMPKALPVCLVSFKKELSTLYGKIVLDKKIIDQLMDEGAIKTVIANIENAINSEVDKTKNLLEKIEMSAPDESLSDELNTEVAISAIIATVVEICFSKVEKALNNVVKEKGITIEDSRGINAILAALHIPIFLLNLNAAKMATAAAIRNTSFERADKLVSNGFAAIAASFTMIDYGNRTIGDFANLIKSNNKNGIDGDNLSDPSKINKSSLGKYFEKIGEIKNLPLNRIALGFNILSIIVDKCANLAIEPVTNIMELAGEKITELKKDYNRSINDTLDFFKNDKVIKELATNDFVFLNKELIDSLQVRNKDVLQKFKAHKGDDPIILGSISLLDQYFVTRPNRYDKGEYYGFSHVSLRPLSLKPIYYSRKTILHKRILG